MLCAIDSKKVVLVTWIAILSCLLLATQALAQDPCEPNFNPSGKSISGNPGDTNNLLTQVTVEKIGSNYECPPKVDIAKPQINWISQPPTQGSINLLDPPPQDFSNYEYPDTTSFDIIMELSPDLSPGIYEFTVTVYSTCSDGCEDNVFRSSAKSGEFTVIVFPDEDIQCCLPVLGPQLNNAGVPGDRVPLATISISNTCYFDTKDFVSRPMVTLEDLDIFPSPGAGRIFLLPVPQQPEVGSGEYETVTIYAVLTEDVPTGFYQIDSTFKVECDSPSQKSQAHEVSGNFTLSVQSEKDRSFFRGLTIPSSFMNGVCAAPGSTVLIPISSIQNPETFKWEGKVNFDNGEKEAKLLAASHNAVVTVIPPGLEGNVNLRVRGPEGVSNTVSIKLDKACASNQGNEVTEEQLREWANQVPED
ncbi:hypothetical protein KGY77_07270, partial [Candidatus Bipolaricaulota bacterium]|nr:hypothetical protein [Candidatus Bipolaricaulota bacterium]